MLVTHAQRTFKWTRVDQVELDHVEYAICTAEDDGRFLAAWVCNGCPDPCTFTLSGSTTEQARARATMSLQFHHETVHGRPRKPK